MEAAKSWFVCSLKNIATGKGARMGAATLKRELYQQKSFKM